MGQPPIQVAWCSMLHPFSAFPSALLALSLAGCSGGSFKAPGQMVLDGNDVVLKRVAVDIDLGDAAKRRSGQRYSG